MSQINLPTSSKRKIPVSADFSIRFAPGQEQTDFVFNNIDDIFTFIQTRTDSSITVYVDLSEWGPSYTLPVRTDYNFNRVFLDGFFNDDGTIPVLKWPEGARIVPECNFIRKRDVDFECEATTTPIWRPTQSSRMEDEENAAYIVSSNLVPFVSTTFMPAGSVLTYQGGAGCGFLNFGGAQPVLVTANVIFRAFLNETCEFQDNTIATFVPSTVDLRLSTEAKLGAQPALVSTTYLVSCKEQSGATFPARTYPGKLFHLTTDDRVYVRNAANTAWLPQAEQVQHNWQPSLVANAVALSFVNKHNFNISVVNGQSYEIDVSYGWNYQEAKKGCLVQLLINGVQQGRSDGTNTYFMKDAPSVVEAPVVTGTGNSERIGFSRKIRYTATTTGNIPVVLRFAPAEAKIAAMWDSLITVRRIS